MNNLPLEKNSQKSSKRRKILWGVFTVLLLLTIFLMIKGVDRFGLFAMATLLFLIFLMLTSKKYYNWTMPFIGVFFIGILFKINHWPFAGVLISISAMMVFFNLLFFSIKSFFVLRHNMFLKWFSFFTGIALALFMYTFMSKLQHWPLFLEFYILKHTINLMLIIIILVLIFRLPGLGFATWLALDRRVFYRLILLPLVIIFAYSISLYVFPNLFDYIFNQRWEMYPWGMDIESVELFKLDGIIL